MTPQEALQMALDKEEGAIELYRDLSNQHPPIRDLLISLMNEEYKHKKLLQDKLSELTRYGSLLKTRLCFFCESAWSNLLRKKILTF
jgi:rubrerythrin